MTDVERAGADPEVEQDRRHERFLIRVFLVALLVIGLFLLIRTVIG